jgi:EpsD family peptidyl-prolyl cis-trans isomerase
MMMAEVKPTVIAKQLIWILILLLSACNQSERPSGQVAARVNGKEISVHQLNQALRQPDKTTQSQRKLILEKLIDRELAIQQAEKLQLMKQPSVMLSLEEARRDTLAAAFVKHINTKQFAPGEGEASKFYTEHPGLFSERKRYQLRVISLNPESPYLAEMEKQLSEKQPLDQVGLWLSGQKAQFNDEKITRLAEQLPIEIIDHLNRAKQGQVISFRSPNALSVYQLLSTESLPIKWEDAMPLIKNFLATGKHNFAVERQIKQLRARSRIEYSEQFQTPK